jgi:hypothetical protein
MMSCSHWNEETYFCEIKQKIINPEDIAICEECSSYKPKALQNITCIYCGASFEPTKSKRIEIKDQEFIKCPFCQKVIGLERDDKTLS